MTNEDALNSFVQSVDIDWLKNTTILPRKFCGLPLVIKIVGKCMIKKPIARMHSANYNFLCLTSGALKMTYVCNSSIFEDSIKIQPIFITLFHKVDLKLSKLF